MIAHKDLEFGTGSILAGTTLNDRIVAADGAELERERCWPSLRAVETAYIDAAAPAVAFVS
jgi:hypothetical protein